MKKLIPLAAIAFATLFNPSLRAHDTWVEAASALVRTGDNVQADLKLGNHGNEHRDFKLAGKLKPEDARLTLLDPSGRAIEVKLTDQGYTPQEGYWSGQSMLAQPGLYTLVSTSDRVVSYAPKRSVKSAKAYVLASASLDKLPKEKGSATALGHPFELVPVTHPVLGLGPGNPIKVQLLFQGKPLTDAVVSFIPRGAELSKEFDPRYERKTDAQGIASFEPREASVYLIVAHHETQEKGEGYDQTKYSATLTLRIPAICPCCAE